MSWESMNHPDLAEPEEPWEDPGCAICGHPSDGYRLCGRCLTEQQEMIEARPPEVSFSDDVIPSQREVA